MKVMNMSFNNMHTLLQLVVTVDIVIFLSLCLLFLFFPTNLRKHFCYSLKSDAFEGILVCKCDGMSCIFLGRGLLLCAIKAINISRSETLL